MFKVADPNIYANGSTRIYLRVYVERVPQSFKLYVIISTFSIRSGKRKISLPAPERCFATAHSPKDMPLLKMATLFWEHRNHKATHKTAQKGSLYVRLRREQALGSTNFLKTLIQHARTLTQKLSSVRHCDVRQEKPD